MKELIPKIEEVLNCYGFRYSHNFSGWDNYYYNPNKEGFLIIFDIKEFHLTYYLCENNSIIFSLEGEHLTLNSICNYLSKL
jgi:hypothetical protein